MKHLTRLLLCLLFFWGTTSALFAQSNKDCSILQKGTFTYPTPEGFATVVINKKTHTECHVHDGKKYYINSSLVWVDDCQFRVTIVKVNVPGFPYPVGTSMLIKVSKIKEDKIYYTAVIGEDVWEGAYTKVK